MLDKVPFLDLTRLHASIREDLDAAYDEVVRTSQFAGGAKLAQFETLFASMHDARGAVGCGSGTDALALGLRALGIGPGDEVVVPSMTFVATAEAVCHVGATPVIAVVDATTLLLTAAAVDEVRTPSTRAVIPVHLFGHAVSRDLIGAWRESGLVVVEDAAQAHLATDHGVFVGSAGDISCFSFYPGKNLGALGDAGLVMSANEEVLERIRVLRDHGRTGKYTHDVIGFCSRLDGLQAALLSAKLRHLPEWTASRRALAARYAERLPEGLLVPWEEGAVHHLLVAQVDERDRVQAQLADAGIDTGVHYPLALSQQQALAPWHRSTPAAERAAARVLSLPMDPLMTFDEVDRVCAALVDDVVGATRH
jgi:dTDP-4-amino-4,6-dideoxygalactose transaminase